MRRWGFIAAGMMARMMADDLMLVGDAGIMAITSRTQQSAENFAKQYGVPKVHESVQELVMDPDVEIVYVSSPHNLHYDHARAALLAGKPVLVEKPFTVNAGQASELVQLSNEKGLFLMEAMWVRYLPIVRTLKRILDDGLIGEIRLFRSAFHQDLDFGPEHRIYNPDLAGGALLDLGIYPISLASFVFGCQPSSIASIPYMGETSVDEHFGAVFHYGGRQMGIVSAGADGLHPQDVMIFGTKGEIRLNAHPVWKYDRMNVTLYGRNAKEYSEPFEGGGYSFQAEEVQECLAGGRAESPAMTRAESVRIMETLDRMREDWGLRYPFEK
jgi:dihydrodiol dehydrogenase / D-xylose 1-dehydrogenase (NADP)